MPAADRTIPLPPFEAPEDFSLNAVRAAFASVPELRFGQNWRPIPESEFQPATLKAGWCPDFLHLLATFTDHDIVVLENHNSGSRLAVGDVFQVFLSLPDAEEYLEIHLTPNNQTQVLGWSAKRFAAFLDGKISLDEILENPGRPPFSETWIEEEEARWTAYLRIPAKLTNSGNPGFAADTVLSGTFCRYDASPGSPAPVLSSTSDFPGKPNFHQNQYWHLLHLAPNKN